MCGIGGVYRLGPEPIKEDVIASLICGNEHRGNDASGIALMQENGDICVHKKDITPWEFIKSPGYLEFIKENLHPTTLAAVVHARGASQGNPRDNNNNHPMYQGISSVIHNGAIHNDDFVFKELKLVRKAATDSDILRAIFDEDGFTETAFKKFNRLSGGVAMAAFHPKYPGKMVIARSGNPLVPASNEHFFVFASEKDTIHRAMRPYILRHGIWFQKTKPDVDFGIMTNHSLWVIGPKGLEHHTSFTTHSGEFREPNRKVYEEYEARQRKFDNAAQNGTGGTGKLHTFPPATITNIKSGGAVPPLVGAKKDFGYCLKCQKEYVIPHGANALDFECPKDKGGCGQTLSPVRKKGAVVA